MSRFIARLACRKLRTETRKGAQRDGGNVKTKSIFEVYETIQNRRRLELRFLGESFSPSPNKYNET